ncbi:hypothetical protein BDR04DRAFT_435919 [Suillus decipiens]|nr:hypothetical protein BDR04DRAFT_435919 [Suillus decipiens]
MGKVRKQPVFERSREPCPRKERQQSPTTLYALVSPSYVTKTTGSCSPTGHVPLTLDTRSHGEPGGLGRDLVAWVTNHDHQLSTGKRNSLLVHTTLERHEGCCDLAIAAHHVGETRHWPSANAESILKCYLVTLESKVVQTIWYKTFEFGRTHFPRHAHDTSRGNDF